MWRALARGMGLPSLMAVATAAVIVQVFGPVALILGVLPRLSGLALAVFVGVMAVLLHPFWQFSGPSAVAERTLAGQGIGAWPSCGSRG